ncbi:hypothetical protein [Dankookia sp. P2]
MDALSDDGAHGVTIIAFIGTVFSPGMPGRAAGAPATRRTIAA